MYVFGLPYGVFAIKNTIEWTADYKLNINICTNYCKL